MSGRTFTYQSSYDDFVRQLIPDLALSQRRKSVGIGDNMLREIEEFMNRFVVTAINDNGDIIFDAAGSYTFQGDVIIGGELQSSNWVDDTTGWQLRSDGTFEFNSSGDVRGDLGVHGNMTMFTGGAMKTNASGQRAEMSEATTSTSIVGGAANFSGIDLYSGDAAEVEPGLLGISNTTSGSSTVVLAAADLYGSGQRPYLYLGSNTAGTLDTRLNDPSRVYLTAGSSSVDINQTGINVNVADGDLDLAVKNLPSSSYQDKINLAEDLFKVTLSNAERMRLDTTGLGVGTNSPAAVLHTAASVPELLRLQLDDSSVAGGHVAFHHNSGRIGYVGFNDADDLYVMNEDTNGLLYFGTNSTTRMTIQADGDVGIGTTSPAAKLDVAGDTTSTGHFTAQSGGADGGIVLGQAFSSSYVGLRTANMSESSLSEYNLITDGNHTFISAGSTGDVYIRGGGNDSACQIFLDTSANQITLTGIVTTTDEIRVGSGSASDPALTFSGDSNTGFYVTGNNGRIHFSGNGVEGGYLLSTGGRFIDGSATAPSYAFRDDTNTGMYRYGTDEIGFSRGGTVSVSMTGHINVHGTDSSLVSFDPPTGTGNDAEWLSVFGVYLLRRNSSTAAEKLKIQDDLEGWLTPDMVDSVVPKMWTRDHAPDYPEIGPIAEDMDAISPFLGTKGTNENGDQILTGIDRNAYLSLLVLAIKDLRARVAELEA